MKPGDIVLIKVKGYSANLLIGIIVRKCIPQSMQKEFLYVSTIKGISRWSADMCEVISESR